MALNSSSRSIPVVDYTPLRGQFADGTRTSGQHAPSYDELRSFEEFPDLITGPTVWKSEDYQAYPERWTHVLTEAEIDEISVAADKFKVSKTPLIDISKVIHIPRKIKRKQPKLTKSGFRINLRFHLWQDSSRPHAAS